MVKLNSEEVWECPVLFRDLDFLPGLQVGSIIDVVQFLDLRDGYIELIGQVPEIIAGLNGIIEKISIC